MFSWDSKKASENLQKHAVSFTDAASLFLDPNGLDWKDAQHSTEEARRKRLARSLSGRILLAVYTIRILENGKETIRIISARQASRKEREAYRGSQD